MAEPLLKPRPAVEAFFEQFDYELEGHFVGEDDFDSDLINFINPYFGTPKYQSANLKFWVENEKRLHEKSDDRENLVRLDVDLMMSVYMFDVLYCLGKPGQEPVMAAYEFVVANSDWFRDNQVDLYENGTLFKKVLDKIMNEDENIFEEDSIQMDWINRLTDGTTFSDEPKTVTELKEAIRIVTESPDRGGAIVPSVNPPSAIKRFIDTARPVFEVLVLPATAVSALLGAVIAGSDAAIRRTANIRNLTETEPEYQDDLQALADREFDTWAQTPPLDLNGNSVGFTDMELMNAKLWALGQGYGIDYLRFINGDPGEQQFLIEQYRNSESAGTDSGYPASFLDRLRQRDAMKRLDQLNQRKEAARARAQQNLEALPPPEQFFPEPDGFLFDEENPGNDFSGIGRGGSEPEPGQRDEVGSGQQSADGQSDPPSDDFDFSFIDSETGQTIRNGGGRPRPNLVDSDNGSFGLNATDAEDAGDSGFAGDPNVEEIQADDGPEIREASQSSRSESNNAAGIQSPGSFRSGYVEWTRPNGTIVTPPGAFDSSAVALSAQELANFNRERAESIRGFMNVVVRLPQNIFGRLLLPVSVVADLVENEFEETGRVEFIPSDSGGSGTVIPIVNLTGSPGINNPFGITANSEAAREQLVRSNQVPDVANNGTIPRLLNQPGSSESGILNLSDSDVDSFARRLLNGRLGGTAVDVDIDTVDLSVDPDELRRQYEADLEFSNVRNANDEGFASDGTSSRRVRFPYSVDATRSSVNPEAFRSLEVGPSGPVPRPLTWSGYNDPAQFNPAYDVIVDGRRIPRYEFENRPPTADEAVREQGAINDAIFRWTGNAVYDVTQGAASVAALPFNLGSAVLGLGTVGDLDSAPEGSQSPSIRRKRAFVDHTQSA